VRVWLPMLLGAAACSGDDPTSKDETGTPMETGTPTEETGATPTGKKKGEEAVLRLEGEQELRGKEWTGTERLHLFKDDLFEPVDVCIISYTVTGTTPRNDCKECNASPEGNGGAHEFVTSGATIETELYDGACDIVLGAETVDAATLDDLNGRTLAYGWGEEATGHGYALFTLDDQDEWFFRELMRNPFENTDGILDKRKVDAYMTYFLFEGTYVY